MGEVGINSKSTCLQGLIPYDSTELENVNLFYLG